MLKTNKRELSAQNTNLNVFENSERKGVKRQIKILAIKPSTKNAMYGGIFLAGTIEFDPEESDPQ